MSAEKAKAYWQLMRMDRPIGSLLLLCSDGLGTCNCRPRHAKLECTHRVCVRCIPNAKRRLCD